jgi:hypothetical protein
MYSEVGKVDASGKYISMCASAKDIQRHWNFKIEDYIFDPADGEARVCLGIHRQKIVILSGCLGMTNYRKSAYNSSCRI